MDRFKQDPKTKIWEAKVNGEKEFGTEDSHKNCQARLKNKAYTKPRIGAALTKWPKRPNIVNLTTVFSIAREVGERLWWT